MSVIYFVCGMSIFVDDQCNRYSLIESQAIRKARLACWMPGETLLVSAGWLWKCWPLKVRLSRG
jgi:hypothetical protein